VYLLIAANGQLSLEDGDNMRSFSIVEEESGLAATQLSAIATPAEEQHYWLDANAVVSLSGRKGDQQWLAGFWDMLAKVEAYGYSDMEKKRVKAHVELA
jgi:hypothetical protein